MIAAKPRFKPGPSPHSQEHSVCRMNRGRLLKIKRYAQPTVYSTCPNVSISSQMVRFGQSVRTPVLRTSLRFGK
jgi:hypothetical protein